MYIFWYICTVILKGHIFVLPTVHKDPYENIYCVISGYKDFILIPPTDAPWVPYKSYPLASYKYLPQSGKDPSPQRENFQEKDPSLQRENSQEIDHSFTRDNLKEDLSLTSEKLPDANKGQTAANGSIGHYDKGSTTLIENNPCQRLEENILIEQSHCVCGHKTTCGENFRRFAGGKNGGHDCIEDISSELESAMKIRSNEEIPIQVSSGKAEEKRMEVSNVIMPAPECPLFKIVPEESKSRVPWIAINPLNPNLTTFPQYSKARPVRVRVHAGDSLYLPSLWFHHVTQSHACVAVNYWYDMNFDIKYNYYQMVQNLTWKNTKDLHENDC